MASELGWLEAVPGSAGPVAEFTALRQEIERRASTLNNLLTLQLTISGAIFSFALSDPGRRTFLLIVPMSTYLLCGRCASQHAGIAEIGRYIRESLSDRVPGGLHWERWLAQNQRPRLPAVSLVEPLFVTFPCVALLALILPVPQLYADDWASDVAEHLTMVGGWLLGGLASVAATRRVWHICSR